MNGARQLDSPSVVLSLKGRTAKKPTTTKKAKAMGVCAQSASVRRSVLSSSPTAPNLLPCVPACLCLMYSC